MAINISTDIAVTTGGKLTDIGAIQGGWRSVSTYSDMSALTGSATLKGKLQNGQVFYVITDQSLYSLSITGNAPFQTYTFNQFEFPMTSSVGGSTDISALNTFTGSIQTEVDNLTSATSSYILVTDTSSMSVFSALTASFIDPTFISASAAASGFGSGEGTHTDISALNTFTGSIQTEVDNLTSATSSYLTAADTASFLTELPSGIISSSDQITITESQISDLVHTDISDLNTFSGSIQSQVDSLIAATSSYLTSETDSQTLTIVGDQLSISNGNTVTIPTGSTFDTSSLVTNDQTASMSVATASYAEYAVSASYEISYEVSSSYADSALTASYIDPNIVTAVITDDYISSSAAASGFGVDTDLFITNDVTRSMFVGTASIALAVQTASYIDPSFISASAAASGFGDVPSGTVSSSTQTIENLVGQDVVVNSITAETYIVSSSVTYMTTSFASGSTMFGDDVTDTHEFTGSLNVTGSVNVGGAFNVNTQNLNVESGSIILTSGSSILVLDTGFISASFTGSLFGTSSWAENSVTALTASYIDPSFISASAAASGFGAGGGIFTPTGSVYSTTNDLEITGSLTVADGVLRLSELTTAPTAEPGAIFYSASNFYFGVSE